uniref:VWFA domain-containing protein n=1 Tax=Amphilophus citrinellus TaxID=61819 RepID=A0A3Q0T315_AMPCI
MRKTTLTCICSSSTVCKDIPSDIIFLTDSSESISEKDFQKMKDFMKTVISKSIVGQNEVHIGVMQYSSSPYLEFDLTQHYNQSRILNAIDKMEQIKEGTRTGRAITEVSHELMVHQILMVITDGEASDPHRLKEESDALRENGITVISIGVMEAKREELETMAGDDTSKVFFVDNFKDLETLYKEVSSVICSTTKPGKRCQEYHLCVEPSKLPMLGSQQSCLLLIRTNVFLFHLAVCNQTDVVFLLDYSSSITPEDHEIMKNFTADVVKSFEVSEKFAHVGLAQFSDNPRDEFDLKKYYNKEDVIGHIHRLEYNGGNTYLGKALRHIKRYFQESGESRRDIPKNLVLFTDGNSHDDVGKDATALRDMGVTVFAIAVGDIYYLQLLQITGASEQVFEVQNFKSLGNIKTKIIDEICKSEHDEPKFGKLEKETHLISNFLFRNTVKQPESLTSHCF